MQNIGTLGEQLIVKWLELHNYNLLKQNWRCRWGEIDLIAQDREHQTIVFTEVKTRSQNNWDEDGLLAVNFSKQEKIIKTASYFLAKYPQLAEFPCRFDVALVSYLKTDWQATITTIDKLPNLDLDMPVAIAQYQLTIKNYLYSAFEA